MWMCSNSMTLDRGARGAEIILVEPDLVDTSGGRNMLIIDILGALLSLLSVYLFTRINSFAWPVSVGANLVNAYLYGVTGIYGHTFLEAYYLLLNLYGWYYWRHAQTELITRCHWQEWMGLGMACILSYPLIHALLSHYTDSNIVVLDSVTTLLNISAFWLMCRGRIESWIVWFIVDSIYLLIYWQKGLPFHLSLMFIYLGLAIRGYMNWQLRLPEEPREFA